MVSSRATTGVNHDWAGRAKRFGDAVSNLRVLDANALMPIVFAICVRIDERVRLGGSGRLLLESMNPSVLLSSKTQTFTAA